MNLIELKQSLAKKEFNNMYIFYGDEYAIMEIYIKNVCNAVQGEIRTSDSVLNVYRTLNTKSLLSTKNIVYIIRDDKEFLSSESVWDDIYKKLNNRGIILILKYSNIDSRSKFSKKFEQYITKFDLLNEDILVKYIKKDLNLKDEYCKLLVQICKNNYGKILLEINKLKNVAKAYKLSDNDCFKMAYNADVFNIEPEDVIQDLVDAIMTRNVKQVALLLKESKEHGDSEMLLLSYLHNTVKAVLQVQTTGTQNDMGKVTGLNGYQLKTAYKYVNRYTCEELVTFMKYIKYCESSIKNGNIFPDMISDYLLINIL